MLTAALEAMRERLRGGIGEVALVRGMLVLDVEPAVLLRTVGDLKAEHGFDLLLDITAIDWPGRTPRFDVVYHLYSTRHFLRIRLKVRVPESDPTVDSLATLFGAARFHERECHDMYGIVFRGNSDLRPILLYEGFDGHPLRKDYAKQDEQPLVRYRR